MHWQIIFPGESKNIPKRKASPVDQQLRVVLLINIFISLGDELY